MTIFLAFQQSSQQHPIPAYSFWQYYIKKGIEEAGNHWVEDPGIDWAYGLVSKSSEEHRLWKGSVWEKACRWLRAHPADLFLSYLYPEQIDVHAIREIQRSGIPCVNFFCDHIRQYRAIPAEFAAFDLNWVPEYNALVMYRTAGLPFIHLPMPMWVPQKLRLVPDEKDGRIAFVGSKDIQRLLFFEELLLKQPGLPLIIRGSGWGGPPAASGEPTVTCSRPGKIASQIKFIRQFGVEAYLRKLMQRNLDTNESETLKSKVGPSPDFEGYSGLVASSAVTVGINRYPSYLFPIKRPGTYSRLRDIEAPMLGACYLAEWAPGLERLYEAGNEIEVFRSAEEFLDKSAMLLADAAKRKALRVNGQKRALACHTIPRSLEKLHGHLKNGQGH